MKYRGKECTSRKFIDATGTGTEWLSDSSVVCREYATRVSSKAEVDAKAVIVVRMSKIDAIVKNARDNIALVKAGALTDNQRDRAIKELSRAVLLFARGEADNE
jgi:hypothetical protein